jgi:hypothetical protein
LREFLKSEFREFLNFPILNKSNFENLHVCGVDDDDPLALCPHPLIPLPLLPLQCTCFTTVKPFSPFYSTYETLCSLYSTDTLDQLYCAGVDDDHPAPLLPPSCPLPLLPLGCVCVVCVGGGGVYGVCAWCWFRLCSSSQSASSRVYIYSCKYPYMCMLCVDGAASSYA